MSKVINKLIIYNRALSQVNPGSSRSQEELPLGYFFLFITGSLRCTKVTKDQAFNNPCRCSSW